MKKVILLSLAACLFATACNKNDLEFTKDGLPTNCAPNEIIYKTQYGYPIELKTDYSNFGGAKLVANLCEDGYCKYIFDADITQIPSKGFSGRVSLISMIIPNSITSIGESAFNGCTSLTSVNIPNSVTSIGKFVLANCTSLTSVTIPDSVTRIGSDAFRGCTSLTSVTIPNSVTSIGGYAFFYCTSLTSATIGNGVTSIGDSAFDGCTALKTITIPDSVTEIGFYAFRGCISLKEVYCKPTTPPTGGYNWFADNASGRKIYVPRNSVNTYKSASYWKDYASYIEGYDF